MIWSLINNMQTVGEQITNIHKSTCECPIFQCFPIFHFQLKFATFHLFLIIVGDSNKWCSQFHVPYGMYMRRFLNTLHHGGVDETGHSSRLSSKLIDEHVHRIVTEPEFDVLWTIYIIHSGTDTVKDYITTLHYMFVKDSFSGRRILPSTDEKRDPGIL